MTDVLATNRTHEDYEGHMWKMDLQLFAGDGVDGEGAGAKATDGEDAVDNKTDEIELPKSAVELQRLIQSEADRRVTGALKTAQEKWQKDVEVKLKAEREEAERLAKLSAEEKEKELLKKQQEEIEKRERAILVKELELKAIDALRGKELPLEFRDFVLGADEEVTSKRVDTLDKLFREAIQKEVDARLKGKSPRQSEDSMDIDLGKQIAEGRNKERKKIDLWEV